MIIACDQIICTYCTYCLRTPLAQLRLQAVWFRRLTAIELTNLSDRLCLLQHIYVHDQNTILRQSQLIICNKEQQCRSAVLSKSRVCFINQAMQRLHYYLQYSLCLTLYCREDPLEGHSCSKGSRRESFAEGSCKQGICSRSILQQLAVNR